MVQVCLNKVKKFLLLNRGLGKKMYKPSKETKKKISNSLKLYFEDSKVKEKLSKLNSGINNPNYGNNLSYKMREKLHNLRVGKRNPSWKNGKYVKGYNFVFNKKFKNAIKIRDNACMICGSNNNLGVHHIDYNKLNSIKENCICLCYNCHAKTNFNRGNWMTFFQSLLKERYNYSYIEVIKI